MKSLRIVLLIVTILTVCLFTVGCFDTLKKPDSGESTTPIITTPENPTDDCEHEWLNATCETPKTCSKCGEIDGEKLGHIEAIDNGKAPTCTEAGLTEGKHCSVCNTVLVAQTVVSAKGHSEVIDRAVAATCTQTGLTEGKHCSVCNTVIVAQTVVSAKGHSEVIDRAVAATCTQTGLTEGKHCSVCNTVLVAQQVVAALGHNAGTAVVENNVAPDCVNDGSYDNVTYCTVCKAETSRETVVVKAPGHDYKAEVTAPDCVNGGYTTYTCTVCGDTYVADKVDALGHTAGKVVVEKEVAPKSEAKRS